MARCQHFARDFRYVLKADVQKFFPSLDHHILKALLARKIKDPDVLWLAGRIIDHSNPQEEVRHWFPRRRPVHARRAAPGHPHRQPDEPVLRQRLPRPARPLPQGPAGGRGYVRYVDDFLVFADDKGFLADVRYRVADFLVGLRLRLHPTKNVIFPVRDGIPFLGYRVFRTHRLLAKENVSRFRRRLRRMQREYAAERDLVRKSSTG